MKLSRMPKDELESYSYIELAKMVLREEKSPMNTPTLFRKICDLLGLSDDDYSSKIGDFYTALTTDKTFVLLDGNWDLRDHHSSVISLDDTEDEEEEELTETEEEIEDEMDDMASESFDDMDDDSDIDEPDLDDAPELEDDELTIIDEDELE